MMRTWWLMLRHVKPHALVQIASQLAWRLRLRIWLAGRALNAGRLWLWRQQKPQAFLTVQVAPANDLAFAVNGVGRS
jgi:hypothetical protein